ncbi:MAG: FprA family A-type flavoprotein [Candidatus Aminicenantes bacterium]|nr:FprA family A-type flavoprotein [Candidatus Aminicenantes bacterium]
MKPRRLVESVESVGVVDWDRRLFDSLIPLPDGTSYNAYLVRGSEKTALLDTVDPAKIETLLENLQGVESLDYVVAHHGEQDHSGSLPVILEKYPRARLVCSPKAKGILMDLLALPSDRITTVADGETLSLGDKTLEFIHTPWVHWPETMCTYLREDRILFSCDFFGSHLAQSGLLVRDEAELYLGAKRYFAEIMMPFRTAIQKNLERVKGLSLDYIAPSHGPVHNRPAFILGAYRDWISETPKNEAVVAYVSMHGSTEKMVGRLTAALAERNVTVHRFDLAGVDLGKLAISLVDAATIVLASPAVLTGLHPNVAYAAFLANALRPKAKFAALIGSFGWGQKMAEQVLALLPNLKVEVLPPLLVKGAPKESDFGAVEDLAETIARKHKDSGLA